MATPGIVGERHYLLAQEIRRPLAQYSELKDIIAMLGLEQLSPEDRNVIFRVRRLAVDEGVLVKTGADALVSVHRAISGTDLAQLRGAVEKEFLTFSKAASTVSARVASTRNLRRDLRCRSVNEKKVNQ